MSHYDASRHVSLIFRSACPTSQLGINSMSQARRFAQPVLVKTKKAQHTECSAYLMFFVQM